MVILKEIAKKILRFLLLISFEYILATEFFVYGITVVEWKKESASIFLETRLTTEIKSESLFIVISQYFSVQ